MNTVSYLRVSGGRGQTAGGLGIESQRQAVAGFCATTGAKLLAEFVEVESGQRNDRPKLAAAMAHARMTGSVLVVARLDRLSRDVGFLISLENSGVEFVACDMPSANRLTVRLMAVLAEQEREQISARTKAALRAAVEVRGQVLGGWRGGPKIDPAVGRAARTRRADAYARDVGAVISGLRANGLSLRATAIQLQQQYIKTPAGGTWTASAVKAVGDRFARLS